MYHGYKNHVFAPENFLSDYTTINLSKKAPFRLLEPVLYLDMHIFCALDNFVKPSHLCDENYIRLILVRKIYIILDFVTRTTDTFTMDDLLLFTSQTTVKTG